MRHYNFFFVLLLCTPIVFGQQKLDKTLKKFNEETVPYVEVDAISNSADYVLLDTRKKEEFEVSHLQNAIWVGYETFEAERVTNKIVNKDIPIIVYCSIGVRSEDIGEKLLKLGYTNVKNLYGGIFEWKNQNRNVYNNSKATDSVHAFDKHWGRLLHKGIKVYETKSKLVD